LPIAFAAVAAFEHFKNLNKINRRRESLTFMMSSFFQDRNELFCLHLSNTMREEDNSSQ